MPQKKLYISILFFLFFISNVFSSLQPKLERDLTELDVQRCQRAAIIYGTKEIPTYYLNEITAKFEFYKQNHERTSQIAKIRKYNNPSVFYINLSTIEEAFRYVIEGRMILPDEKQVIKTTVQKTNLTNDDITEGTTLANLYGVKFISYSTLQRLMGILEHNESRFQKALQVAQIFDLPRTMVVNNDNTFVLNAFFSKANFDRDKEREICEFKKIWLPLDLLIDSDFAATILKHNVFYFLTPQDLFSIMLSNSILCSYALSTMKFSTYQVVLDGSFKADYLDGCHYTQAYHMVERFPQENHNTVILDFHHKGRCYPQHVEGSYDICDKLILFAKQYKGIIRRANLVGLENDLLLIALSIRKHLTHLRFNWLHNKKDIVPERRSLFADRLEKTVPFTGSDETILKTLVSFPALKVLEVTTTEHEEQVINILRKNRKKFKELETAKVNDKNIF